MAGLVVLEIRQAVQNTSCNYSVRTLDKGFNTWNLFQKYSTLKFELVAMLHVQQRKVLVKFQFIYLFCSEINLLDLKY